MEMNEETKVAEVAVPAATAPKKVVRKRVVKVAGDKPAVEKKATATPVVKALKGSTAPVSTGKAKVPAVHVHRAAGVDTSAYGGASDMINANRKTKVMLGKAITTGSLSDRMKTSLYALRKSYSASAFRVKGFDNGVIRDLLAAGLITLSGGTIDNIDGTQYQVDAATPVMAKFTKTGMTYGTVPQANAGK